MIDYQIEGGNLPVVICNPEERQTLCAEKGSMSWMSSNMHMETNAGAISAYITPPSYDSGIKISLGEN